MPNGMSKGGNVPEGIQTGSHARGVWCGMPPDDRGKKETRGKDDDKHQWWEEGCNGVAMDAINNQLGVAERQWTRDDDDDYDRDYVDDCSNDDNDDDRGGDRSRWRQGRER